MRRILLASTVTLMVGLPIAVRGEDREGGLISRGRDVMQAGFHKSCCNRSPGGPCRPCGQNDIEIGKLIDTLFHAERACDRKHAALRLDEFNWTQHPEIVAALTYAMQSDCDRCVRIAAADSLKDMMVGDPDSIGAMEFTHETDPSYRVRYKAKWGVIKGERSQPPGLTYVAGYGPTLSEPDQVAPRPMPQREPPPLREPEKKPTQENGTGTEARRSVRSMISSAMAKVRPRS